jgi:5-(carboxyamino)imidazole ribonucleotide synthase
LIERCDVVTFEFEAVPKALLERLETAERAGAVSVRPRIDVLRIISNKVHQKRWMVDNAIPTLPFTPLPAERAAALAALEGFRFPLVQKAATGGYDGKGVQVLQAPEDLERLWPIKSLVEPYLPERPEIAVVLARGIDGDTQCFEPVRMQFDDRHNVLDFMSTPAGLDSSQHQAALEIAVRVVTALDGVGVFSVEMFITPAGDLVVNEIAPRVHNAGHHTIEACAVSQFQQHLRAVAGLPLHSTEGERPAVMQNLLYDDSMVQLLTRPPGVLKHGIANTAVHWYGKTEGRQGRKMGHITMLADDLTQARANAKAALKSLTGRSVDEVRS